jgi:hypothetical protein
MAFHSNRSYIQKAVFDNVVFSGVAEGRVQRAEKWAAKLIIKKTILRIQKCLITEIKQKEVQ